MVCHALKSSTVPMWIGLNSMIIDDKSPMQKVHYLMPRNMSPTDTSVVYEALRMTTYDLQIAKVALAIQSTEKPAFDCIFIQMLVVNPSKVFKQS